MSAPSEAQPSKARRARRRAIDWRSTLRRSDFVRWFKEAEE